MDSNTPGKFYFQLTEKSTLKADSSENKGHFCAKIPDFVLTKSAQKLKARTSHLGGVAHPARSFNSIN